MYDQLTTEQYKVMMNGELKTHALMWLNSIRLDHNAEPVQELCKGWPEEPNECVIARTLGGIWAHVDTTAYGIEAITHDCRTVVVQTPSPLQDIIMHKFDAGLLPELYCDEYVQQTKLEELRIQEIKELLERETEELQVVA